MIPRRITVMAHAYRTSEGKRLFILSPRTNNGIMLRENWFDSTVDLMFLSVSEEHRINNMSHVQVPVAFDLEQLKRFWYLYKKQQYALKKRLPNTRGKNAKS